MLLKDGSVNINTKHKLLNMSFQTGLPFLNKIKGFLSTIHLFIYINVQLYLKFYITQIRYLFIIRKIRHKIKLRVIFFVIHSSVWKYDILYRIMRDDPRFDPIIVVCPYTANSSSHIVDEMVKVFHYFEEKQFQVVNSYDIVNKKWLDIKKELNPDIVFFTNPHLITKKEYYIDNFLDCLTCYVPYGFMIAAIQKVQFDQTFHNLLWKGFYETPIHLSMAKKYSRIKGRNVIITGYPIADLLLDKKYQYKDPWKIKKEGGKKIIWAPHHSIEEVDSELGFSCFLSYAEPMLEIASKYAQNIQIAFKPHPLLKTKLYRHNDWGIVKTDQYFDKWVKLENGQLEEGEYVDLFLSSDGIILDSISFIAEYLLTGKPLIFSVRDNSIMDKFNEFGEEVFKLVYIARSRQHIEELLVKTIINGNDYMNQKRKEFLDCFLTPPNNTNASYNIVNHIKTYFV